MTQTQEQPQKQPARRGGFLEALLGSPVPTEWHDQILRITRHVTLTAIWAATGTAAIFLSLLVCWAVILTAVRLPSIL